MTLLYYYKHLYNNKNQPRNEKKYKILEKKKNFFKKN